MHRFDPANLKKQLESLPHSARVAFALACAERLALSNEQIQLAQSARATASKFVLGGITPRPEMDLLAAQLAASPQIDQDDVAACAYVLDCVRTNDPQAAVWAAQRAYDACDLAAQSSMEFTTYTNDIEIAVLAVPAVQAELASQASDIFDLQENSDTAPKIVSRALCRQHG
jgi:hypothetical protein